MTKPRPWTAAETTALRNLHAQGLPANQIAKRMQRPVSTIHYWSKKLGLSYDRTQMEKAIQASQIDRKAARNKIIEDLYRRAQYNLDRLNQPQFETLVKSGPGEETPMPLEFVPSMDERNIIQAVATSLTSAARLEEIDNDGGLIEARGLLGTILGAIQQSVDGLPTINPSNPKDTNATA